MNRWGLFVGAGILALLNHSCTTDSLDEEMETEEAAPLETVLEEEPATIVGHVASDPNCNFNQSDYIPPRFDAVLESRRVKLAFCYNHNPANPQIPFPENSTLSNVKDYLLSGMFVMERGSGKYVSSIAQTSQIPLFNLVSIRASRTYPATLDVTTPLSFIYGSVFVDAQRLCQGDFLNTVDLGTSPERIFICAPHSMVDFEINPFSICYVAAATDRKDALGRPIYQATSVTPLDQEGQPQK